MKPAWAQETSHAAYLCVPFALPASTDAHYHCSRTVHACEHCGQSMPVVARRANEALLSPLLSAECDPGGVQRCDHAKERVFSAANGCDCELCCRGGCKTCASLWTTSGTATTQRSETTARSFDWDCALCARPNARHGGLEAAETHATGLSEHCGWGCGGCVLHPGGGRANASARWSDVPLSLFWSQRPRVSGGKGWKGSFRGASNREG